jgi:hypothetical protein
VVKVATQPASSQPAIVENTAVREAKTKEEKRIRDILEEARTKLIVKSTIVSGGTTEPMTLVNKEVLRVGDFVMGFEIIAIREREVEFRKQEPKQKDVTVIVPLSDGQNKP